MKSLVISPDFTIEDIHKIREQNYERTKDMTVAEKVTYYNNSGKEAEREIERRRALKRKGGERYYPYTIGKYCRMNNSLIGSRNFEPAN